MSIIIIRTQEVFQFHFCCESCKMGDYTEDFSFEIIKTKSAEMNRVNKNEVKIKGICKNCHAEKR